MPRSRRQQSENFPLKHKSSNDDVLYGDDVRKYEKRLTKDGGKILWDNLKGKLFIPISTMDTDELINFNFVFRIIFSIRVATGFWTVLNDCDEVYNYWEQLHLMLFGRGFQTWEYSPIYAIRSWLYIFIYYIPASFLHLIYNDSKIALFITMKITMSLFHGLAEYFLIQSIAARLGNSIAKLFFSINILSVGSFYAGSAFLPSSFSMIFNMFSMAFWLKEKWFFAILTTAISALVGWPFAAILGLPIVIEMLIIRRNEHAIKFIKMALISGFVVLAMLYTYDSHYYGKTVIAPLNIILYNVISGHGPELYGVEPFTYYIKNLILNWNIAPLIAIISIPLSLFVYIKSSYKYEIGNKTINGILTRPQFTLLYWYRYIPISLLSITTLLWLIIFFTQPHKEERFLFPIYPHISIFFAITIYSLSLILPEKISQTPHFLLMIFSILSLSRGFILYKNYHSIQDTHKQFYDYFLINPVNDRDFTNMQDPIRACIGKEWHRFPSSFYLPEYTIDKHGNKRQVELEFIKSGNKGLLPKHYPNMTKLVDITRHIPSNMNDENKDEPSRYVPIETCDFIFHFDDGTDGNHLEPNYSKDSRFKVLYSNPMIIPEKSHWLYRAFYVPYYSNKYNTYGQYMVLQKKDKNNH